MRLARVIVPGVPHHIMIQGNNRRLLFSQHPDYRLFLQLVDDARERYPCAIHHLAMMPNHVHFMITPPTKEMASRFMQSFEQRYAQRRNWKRGGSGKLFRERYRSVVIESERQLAVCAAYIELNPVKAGLCDHPGKWRWSTYNLHVQRPELTKVSPKLWTPLDWYRGMGAENFARWVDECRARHPPEWEELERALDEPEPDEIEVRVRRPDDTRAT
jgi:putative transposase